MTVTSTADDRFMGLALEAALHGLGRAAPNPCVGAVLVKDGRVIARGGHRHDGGPHAESIAIAEAGTQARGATLYVTLEPCCHVGRQPPCTEAIQAAGIREVVVGMVDPDHRMSGRGIQQLTEQGIRLRVGVRQEDCEALDPGYIHRQDKDRPRVLLKTASTLEGNVATHSGHSKWITGGQARALGHALRARVGAVMIGRGTLAADAPRLTARFEGQQPWWRIDNDYQPKRLVVGGSHCGHSLPPDGGERWYLGPGIGADFERYIDLPRSVGGEVDWPQALRRLSQHGINALLVEGGPQLAGSMVRAGVVDEWLAFTAPATLGGIGRPALGGEGSDHMTGAARGQVEWVERLGDDVLMWTRFSEGPSFADQEKLLRCLWEERS